MHLARLVALLLPLTSLAAAPVGDVIFRAGFEGGYPAEIAGGDPAALTSGAVARVPDRQGHSLVVRGDGALRYAATGNIDLRQGSAIFWVRPESLAAAGATVPLFRAGDGAASLALWWDHAQRNLRFGARSPAAARLAVKPAYDWVDPGWHYLILTWTADSLTLYVDGQATVGKPSAAEEGAPLNGIILGGLPGEAATLSYRGLTILSTALTAEAAHEKYRVALSGQVQHERPRLTAGQCAAAPSIDGKVTAAEWASAGGSTALVEIASGVLSATSTRFLVTYDATNLYLAFLCPGAGKPQASKYARDGGAPWDEEAVEAWLQPEVGFTGKYFHLIVNAAGSLYDAEDQSAAWNGVAAWAAAGDEQGWSAEIAVPHASLGTLAPTPGTRWQANFCRNLGSSGTTNRHTAWAFTNGGAYGVWQWFGALEFQPQGPLARVTELVATGSDARARVELANLSRQPVALSAQLSLFRAGASEETQDVAAGPFTIPPGESRSETVSLAAPFAGDQVKLQVRDAARPILVQMVRAGAKEAVVAAPVVAAAAGAAAPAAPPLTPEMLGAVLRERELWQDNTIGISAKVPAPWTPLAVQGRRIACWGRTYDYEQSLLPRQISAQGSELLAGPMELVARVGGREVVFQKSGQPELRAAPHQVDLEAVSEQGDLTARVRSHLEYDGCIKLTLTLSTKGQPVTFESLELRIPLRPERARYYHWFEATRDPRLTNAGAVPEQGLQSHFKPLLWLGDDDRGLCWFSESPRGWQISNKEDVLRVERGRDATTMRIRMVDRPWVLASRWETVFGLQATPTRPTPPGWRDWLIPLNQTNPWRTWGPGFNNLSGTDDPGTLIPRDPAAMKRWLSEVQQHGEPCPFYPSQEPTKVIPYNQVVFWSGKHRDGMPSPEIKVFGPEWSNVTRPPGPRREADAQIPLKEYYWVCPNSSFTDFFLYKLNALMEQVPLDGIYIDGSWWFCSNKLHGCGYADDQGAWQMQYNVWSFRELFKRMYCLFQEKRQDPVLHFHTSCWLAIPSLSFCHMMLDGEQYHDAGQKVEDHFMDVVPLDKWRAEHSSHFGPAPFILPDIPGQWAQASAPTRELLMLTNLHDVGIFPGSFNLRLMMRNYQARRLFGVAACEFKGYWNDDWAACPTPDGHVSIYRQPDGSRCLLVVGNSAKEDRLLSVQPKLAALRLTTAVEAGVDLETGERIPLTAGGLAVPVKARDYRLIALPYYPAPPITAGDLRASALTALPNPGFEQGLSGWMGSAIEGNAGSVSLDQEVKFAGQAACRLSKAEGPGGVHLETQNSIVITPGRRYRLNGQLKIANSTGAQAYWMVGATDNEGASVLSNNLFAGFVKENQDWKPLPFEFEAPAGAVAIRVHFLVAFPGSMDAWLDEVTLEEVKP